MSACDLVPEGWIVVSNLVVEVIMCAFILLTVHVRFILF